jgi:voltage-gated potassium channel
MSAFKRRIFLLVDDNNPADLKWNNRFNFFIMMLIIVSIIAIIIESDKDWAARYGPALYALEVFAIAVFTIEYLLRVWVAGYKYSDMTPFRATMRFIFTPMALIDLLAIIPFYLELVHGLLAAFGIVIFDLRFLRTLRLLRLLRILKLNRYSKSLRLVTEALRDKKEELMITIFLCVILLILSSALMFNIEKDAQPEAFPNILAAFWWAIATLTTVGYGDVYPVTAMGKFMSGIIALLGIGLIALPTGIVSSAFIEKISAQKRDTHIICPECGHEFDQEEHTH